MQGFHFGDKLVVELVPSCIALGLTVSVNLNRGIHEEQTWSYRLVPRNVRDGRLHPYGAVLHAVHKATAFRPHVRFGYDHRYTYSYR